MDVTRVLSVAQVSFLLAGTYLTGAYWELSRVFLNASPTSDEGKRRFSPRFRFVGPKRTHLSNEKKRDQMVV